MYINGAELLSGEELLWLVYAVLLAAVILTILLWRRVLKPFFLKPLRNQDRKPGEFFQVGERTYFREP